jgi:hypothetical protein
MNLLPVACFPRAKATETQLAFFVLTELEGCGGSQGNASDF